MDSTRALLLEDVPRKLLVVGGGYIGMELGSVYAALGSEITVVEATPGLLPGADRDLVVILQKRLEAAFKEIRLDTKVVALKEEGDGISVTFEGKHAGEEKFDKLLVAVGRRPNGEGLGLENTAIELDKRGFIPRQRATPDAGSEDLRHRRRSGRPDARAQSQSRRAHGG